MHSNGVESIYWAGSDACLMDIYNFPGFIYTTDGSKGSTGMGDIVNIILFGGSSRHPVRDSVYVQRCAKLLRVPCLRIQRGYKCEKVS